MNHKIAVIGAGRWGSNHIRTLHDLGNLGGVIEVDATRLHHVQNKYPAAKTYSGLHAVGAKDFAAYVVATPAETHFGLAKFLLEHDKHVLVEKPLALNSHEAGTLEQLAQQRGKVLMVGHVMLFHPAIAKIKMLIDSGKVGKLQYLYSNRLNLGTVRTEENILWSFAPHDVSIFQYLIGARPEKVASSGATFLRPGIHDTTMTSLHYPGNVVGHIFVSWLHPFKEHRVVIIGSKGMLSFEDSSPQKSLVFYEKGIDWIKGEPITREGPTEIVHYENSPPLQNELKYFMACLNGGPHAIANGASAVEVLEILEMAGQALQPGPALATAAAAKNYFVHPLAVVDDNVAIGEGTKIWHFSHVQAGAKIGKNCVLGQNVNVGNDVTIGNFVKIQNNVSIYEGVALEDYVFCGPSMVFTNILDPRSKYPQVGKQYYLKTLVQEGASLGANCTIVCGHTIGRHAFVGAGAVVTKDVPDHALVLGNPAKIAGWISEAGKKLAFDARGEAYCEKSKKRYRLEQGRVRELAVHEKNGTEKIGGVPLLDLNAQYAPIQDQVMAAMREVFDSKEFILGPKVAELETKLAEYCQCRHAIGVSSGTDAILVALMALGLGPGDEVITSPFSFFATAGCIARVGARPVFVDIDPRTYNIDPDLIEAKITPATKALMPVHLFGQIAEMDKVMALARQHNLFVIEDAAQALGAEYQGRRAGAIGEVGCFSFFPSKNLGGCGDGGLVTTNDAVLAEKISVLRAHGGKPKYHHQVIGGNFRLDPLQAAVLMVKLPFLEEQHQGRRRNAAYYDARLSEAVHRPFVAQEQHMIYNQYTIRTARRDELQHHLNQNKIGNAIYYPIPLHLQKCFDYLGYRAGDCPEAENAAKEVISIPIYAELAPEQLDEVIAKINVFVEQ